MRSLTRNGEWDNEPDNAFDGIVAGVFGDGSAEGDAAVRNDGWRRTRVHGGVRHNQRTGAEALRGEPTPAPDLGVPAPPSVGVPGVLGQAAMGLPRPHNHGHFG